MGVPQTTALQLIVMGALLAGEESGQHVRDELAKYGERKSGPAFYQLMARMEDEDLVKGRYNQYVLEGQPIKERMYKLTAKGLTTWERARDFYAQVIAIEGG